MTPSRSLLFIFNCYVALCSIVVISFLVMSSTAVSAGVSPTILTIRGVENSCEYDHEFNWADLPDSAAPHVDKKDLTPGTHYKVTNNCGSEESLILRRGRNQLTGFVWYSDTSTDSAKLLPVDFELVDGSSAFLYVPTSAEITSGPLGAFRTLIYNSAGMFLPFATDFTVGNPIIVDSLSPTILEVRSTTTDGSYRVGHQISIEVLFSEPVTVSTVLGSPTIRLETGAIDNVATYSSGSGTQTLIFQYQVQVGDYSLDLDYSSTSALELNNSLISDTAGNSADTSLPALGSSGSIAAVSQIILDTQSPLVSISRLGTLILGPDDVAFVEFDMNEPVFHFEETSIDVVDGVLSNFDGSRDHFTVQVSGIQNAEGSIRVSIPANSFDDLAGNGNVASEFLLVPFKTFIDAIPDVEGEVEPVVVVATNEEKPVEAVISSPSVSETPQQVTVLRRSTLPATGNNSADTLWIALLFVAMGSVVLVSTRRLQQRKLRVH